MKKIVLLLLILTTLWLEGNLFAQQKDTRAKKVLDEVKNKYKAMKAFRAYFTYSLANPTAGVTETFQGDITVKGNKYFLILPKQEVINNGATQWTYIKDANEVNISDAETDDGGISPGKIYTIYEKGYDYAFIEEKTEGGQVYEMIDLKPLDKNSQYFKIRLKVVKSSKSIKSWEIFEKNANRFLYTVERFATVSVGDGYFKYNPARYPSNPEVIDLR